jgi:hypothetical protein
MKTSVIKMIFVLLVGISFSAAAQQATEEATTKKEIAEMDTVPKKSIWDKKFLIGITFDNAVVSIKGANLPQDYFFRPGVGGAIKAEYYFTKNIGLTAGLAWETRGAGIITPDNVADLGDADSTHRARIKFYSLEAPIALVLRGIEPIKGTRLHAEFGVTPTRNIHSKYIFLSIEDGFHKVENHSDQYYKTDVLIHAQFGIDIDAAEACVFQIHFWGNWGTGNVYNQTAFPGADGQSRLYGIRLGWLF